MFSQDAKDEVASYREHRACCIGSFVRALRVFGKVRRLDGARTLVVASERAAVTRAIIAAAHKAKIQAHARRASHAAAGGRWLAELECSGALLGALSRTSLRAQFPALPRRKCCRHALLRAAFLACGSVSDPAHGYHLEFFCRDDDAARLVCDLIATVGGDAGMTRRRGRPLAYVKDAQTVSTLLAHLGATRAVLRLEEQRALRQTKNSIHRTVNSEAANAARAAVSAARQREAAQRILASARAVKMSPAVREAARLRIAHPARTLAELARAARPPITKAAMASRMRLLERISKR